VTARSIAQFVFSLTLGAAHGEGIISTIFPTMTATSCYRVCAIMQAAFETWLCNHEIESFVEKANTV